MKKRSICAVYALCVILLGSLAALPALATTWDLAADWSDEVNPNPSWGEPTWMYCRPAADWMTPNPIYDQRVELDNGGGADFGPVLSKVL